MRLMVCVLSVPVGMTAVSRGSECDPQARAEHIASTDLVSSMTPISLTPRLPEKKVAT